MSNKILLGLGGIALAAIGYGVGKVLGKDEQRKQDSWHYEDEYELFNRKGGFSDELRFCDEFSQMSFNEIVEYLEQKLKENAKILGTLGTFYNDSYDSDEYKDELNNLCENITNKHLFAACEILLDYVFRFGAINEALEKMENALDSNIKDSIKLTRQVIHNGKISTSLLAIIAKISAYHTEKQMESLLDKCESLD